VAGAFHASASSGSFCCGSFFGIVSIGDGCHGVPFARASGRSVYFFKGYLPASPHDIRGIPGFLIRLHGPGRTFPNGGFNAFFSLRALL
jgi:hypothetical protein